MGAAGLVVLIAYLSGAASGIGTADHDHAFSFADGVWAQTLASALDTPKGPSPSALGARAAMAVAKGRRTAPRDAAAVAAAATSLVFGLWLVEAGIAPLAAVLAVLAMALGPAFWWRGVSWTHDSMAPLCAVTAVWAAWRWHRDGRLAQAAVGLAAAAMAIIDDPAWAACLPAATAFFWPDATLRRRVGLVVVGLVLAACAVLPVVDVASRAAGAPWAAVLGAPAPNAWALLRGSVGRLDAGGAAVAAGLGFTPLSACLAMAGVGILWTAGAARRTIVALAAGVIGWAWLAPGFPVSPTLMPLAVAGTGTVAVALAWMRHVLPRAQGLAVVTLAGALMLADPSLTRAREVSLGEGAESEYLARVASAFRAGDLEPGTALLASTRRADVAVHLSSWQAGRPTPIVPQDVVLLHALLDRHQPVAAFGLARRHAERMGFLFERRFAGNTAVGMLAGRAACVDLRAGEWTDVSLIAASGSVSLQGPRIDVAPAGMTLHLAAPNPIELSAIRPRFATHRVDTGTGRSGPGLDAVDTLAATGTVGGPVTTVTLPAGDRPEPIELTFTSPPAAAVATSDGAGTARLCPGPLAADLMLGRDPSARAVISLGDPRAFGLGWHALEVGGEPFRWTAAARSTMDVTMAPTGGVRVTITASPAARPSQQPEIGLAVNGCRLERRPMPAGQTDHEWDVDATCWRDGINRLWIDSGPLVSPQSLGTGSDTRLLGARVGAIRLARLQNAK